MRVTRIAEDTFADSKSAKRENPFHARPDLQTIKTMLKLMFQFNDQDPEFHRFASQCSLDFFTRNKMILSHGAYSDHIYVIVDGIIKIFRSSTQGKRTTYAFLRKGQLLPELNPLFKIPHGFSAIALMDTVCLKIPYSVFFNIFLHRQTATLWLISQLTKFQEQISEWKLIRFDRVEIKIARLFLEMSKDSNLVKSDNKTTMIIVPLTRKDIAEVIDSTVETVIRIIQKWRKKGILHVRAKIFSILDINEIRKIAEIAS